MRTKGGYFVFIKIKSFGGREKSGSSIKMPEKLWEPLWTVIGYGFGI